MNIINIYKPDNVNVPDDLQVFINQLEQIFLYRFEMIQRELGSYFTRNWLWEIESYRLSIILKEGFTERDLLQFVGTPEDIINQRPDLSKKFSDQNQLKLAIELALCLYVNKYQLYRIQIPDAPYNQNSPIKFERDFTIRSPDFIRPTSNSIS